MSGGKILEQVEIQLKNKITDDLLTVYIDVFDNSLSRKWISALDNILTANLHLEKNYCFMGFAKHQRNAEYLCKQINQSINAINSSGIGYTIQDYFSPGNTMRSGPVGDDLPGGTIIHEKFNNLHRYFEDLQGVSGNMSKFYNQANDETRWHIRQLNLLCHEFESWAMSYRHSIKSPDWQRPSQLMCWLNSPRFILEEEDYELFGIETIARPLGGVFVGVNKAVGKHHWEVFRDEGRDSRLSELTTSTMRSQTEAAGDFDIEWGQNPGKHPWMYKELDEFREWLTANGFDPNDKSLTIGHPQCAQVDLVRSFGTEDFKYVWEVLNDHLDVFSVSTSNCRAEYPYHWNDSDYMQQQVQKIKQGK